MFSKPLNDDEIDAVRKWLGPPEAEIFFSQADPDQRHGYHAASVVVGSGEKDVMVVRAALLHDVGKRHARLGLIGRSLASVLIRLRLPLTRRARLYRDHGEIGADDLAGLGCEAVVVDFARAHHGQRPVSISRAQWELLQSADQPPKTGSKLGA
ncbi:MAG: HDIG domain-containing protein [Actinomycetota bacterium]|nr:HDIG domain-containing protein [Actinomycetota bacterium]